MTVERPHVPGPPGPGASLTLGDRQAVLALARRAIAQAAAAPRGSVLDAAMTSDAAGPAPAGLDRPAALFVTVRVVGALRGCIGTFEPTPSLWCTVFEMATAAATRDPRFAPIAAGELDEVSVEISVLSAPRRITSLAQLVLGRHGVEIENGGRRGVLLPQVAKEHGMDAETFVAETCRKAGLSPMAWRDPETEMRVFEAEIFSDAG